MAEVLFNKRLTEKMTKLIDQALYQHARVLKQRIEKDILPKVSGEELRRTQLVLGFLEKYIK